MTKLIISEKTIPLRKIPEEEFNTTILTVLMPRISRLLSLTDKTSAERLEIALPAIKEHCLGMGLEEIQKMFELYVDGKLYLEPIPNYFDRILLGKIVRSYRSYKLKLKPVKIIKSMTDNEKHKLEDQILNRVSSFFKINRYIHENDFYVYDILEKRGLISLSIEEKKSIKNDAITILKNEYSVKKAKSKDEFKYIQSILKSLEIGNNAKIKIKSKQLASEEYFRSLKQKTSPKD